jgi:hypothetical protein
MNCSCYVVCLHQLEAIPPIGVTWLGSEGGGRKIYEGVKWSRGESWFQSLRNIDAPLFSFSRLIFVFAPLQMCNQKSMLELKKYWKDMPPPWLPNLTELDSQKVSKTNSILRYQIHFICNTYFNNIPWYYMLCTPKGLSPCGVSDRILRQFFFISHNIRHIFLCLYTVIMVCGGKCKVTEGEVFLYKVCIIIRWKLCCFA